jgi:hypothetical protein
MKEKNLSSFIFVLFVDFVVKNFSGVMHKWQLSLV